MHRDLNLGNPPAGERRLQLCVNEIRPIASSPISLTWMRLERAAGVPH